MEQLSDYIIMNRANTSVLITPDLSIFKDGPLTKKEKTARVLKIILKIGLWILGLSIMCGISILLQDTAIYPLWLVVVFGAGIVVSASIGS